MKKITGDKLQHEVIKTSQAFYRDQELEIEFGGETAATNGKTVMIPNVPTDHEFTLDEAAVIRGFVDHEAGHGRHTNFGLAKRSRSIKADLNKYEHYMPITNGIEDVRIERLIVQEYVGAKANIAHTSAYANNMYLELYEQDPSVAQDIAAVGAVAVTWEGRRRIGYADPTIQKCLDTLPKEILKKVERVVDKIDQCKDTKGSFSLAKKVMKDWGLDVEKPETPNGEQPQDGENPTDQAGGQEQGSGSGGGSSTSQEQQSGEQSSEQSNEKSNEQSSQQSGTEGDGPPIVAKQTSEAMEGNDGSGKDGGGNGWGISNEAGKSHKSLAPAIEVNLDKAITNVIPAGSGHGYRVLYGADDLHITKKSNGILGDRLRHVTHVSRNHGYFSKILGESSAHTNRMRRKLERALQSKMERTWRGGYEDGTLNSRALASALSGNQAIYRSRQDVEELDTCVCMMLDASSSMRSRSALALQSVVALSKLFDKMGIPFMVAAFNMDAAYHGHPKRKLTWYKNRWHDYGQTHGMNEAQNVRPFPIAIYMLKQFEEQLKSAQDSIAAYDDIVNGSNIDGCAVRQVADSYLLPRHEKRKILLTFSDGQPCGGDGEYERLANVIKSLDNDGVDCIGVGIQSSSVSGYYPNWVEVRDLEDLSKAAMDKIAKLLMGKRFKVDSRDAA